MLQPPNPQPVQQQYGRMNPMMWMTLGSNILAANGLPGNIPAASRLGIGIRDAIPQMQRMAQGRYQREQQQQQLQVERDMRKEVSTLAQQGLKTLDLDGSEK